LEHGRNCRIVALIFGNSGFKFGAFDGHQTLMRAIFVIYIAAGITLFFAVLSTVSGIGNAYKAHRGIVIVNSTGYFNSTNSTDFTLGRMQSVQNDFLDTAAESFTLALLQGAIIVYARKLGNQSKAA
jgi:hypothetical protein